MSLAELSRQRRFALAERRQLGLMPLFHLGQRRVQLLLYHGDLVGDLLCRARTLLLELPLLRQELCIDNAQF